MFKQATGPEQKIDTSFRAVKLVHGSKYDAANQKGLPFECPSPGKVAFNTVCDIYIINYLSSKQLMSDSQMISVSGRYCVIIFSRDVSVLIQVAKRKSLLR